MMAGIGMNMMVGEGTIGWCREGGMEGGKGVLGFSPGFEAAGKGKPRGGAADARKVVKCAPFSVRSPVERRRDGKLRFVAVKCKPGESGKDEEAKETTTEKRLDGEKEAKEEGEKNFGDLAKAIIKNAGVSLVKFFSQGPVVFIGGVVSGVVLTFGLFLLPDGAVVRESVQEKVTLFDIIMQDITRNYVEPVDEEKLFETGMRAMLSSLDPYTQFENDSQAREMNVKTMGKYGGVGLGLAPDLREPKRLVVVSAFEGYAFDAGVRPGDYIERVDGLDVSGRSIEAVTDMLRGSPGTSVDLTVSREGQEKQLTFNLNRRYVNIRDVPVAAVIDENDGIGYIKLQSFAKDAAAELRRAISQLVSQTELRAIVLDLRGNPGGLLNSSVEVAEALVPKGSPIVSTKGRNASDMKSYSSSKSPTLPENVRMAVLVNGQTASAAEIVAGAIQDLDLGLIVGTKTFGKGLIQNIQSLPYRTALRYTVGRYYTPSGRCIQSLNYSSESGTLVAKMNQDQDRAEFRTLNGRIVRDGGGIDVDVVALAPPPSELQNSLTEQGLFFYFANMYAAKLDGALPQDFHVTDKLYNEFISFVDDSKFEYKSRLDSGLESLEQILKEEGYSDAGHMGELRRTISAEMRLDFVRHRHEVQKQIEHTIRMRTQKESTRLIAEAKNDDQVSKAVELLKNQNLYSQLLQSTDLESKLATAENAN